MNRVKVTHQTLPRLYHVTNWTEIDSVYDIGLRPGGLDKNGRQESFFSCQSQAAGRNPEAQKKIWDYYAACNNFYYLTGNNQGNPSALPGHVGYQYDTGDVAICIDTKLAEECGEVFWQNGSFAILAGQTITPNCFIHVENTNTGGILKQKSELPQSVRQSPKNVDKLFLSGSIDEVTDGVLSSSANAGGDRTAETIISQFRNLPSEGKPKYIPGGKAFFGTVGVKGLPSQQMDTPGASSSSEPAGRRNPWGLLSIPVDVHVDTPKTPPGLETVLETKEEELPEADWGEVDPAMPELSDITNQRLDN
jgi:hypothetical protein